MCKRLLVTALALSICSFATAQEALDTTVYNCDTTETAAFIKKSAYAFYAPTAVPTTAEMKTAYIDAKQAAGGQACLSALTDGTFSDEWKGLVDGIRNTDYSFPSLDPDLGAMYELMKTAVEEQLTAALETLGEDICKFMSKDNLEKLALKAIARETGVRSRELSIDAFAAEIEDLVYDAQDEDVKRLLSKKKMKRDVSNETRKELRQIRRDLWDNL